MIKHVLRYCKGYVQIRFTGNEKERFLNLCSANGMVLWNIRKDELAHTACMSIDDFKKLRPISRKTKTKVRITKRLGLPFFFQRNRKRKAFFLGILLFTGMIYLLSLRIWNIHIEGNIIYSTSTILKYLEEQDICHGIRKEQVNCSEIASMLRRNFTDITWVSAKIEGTRLLLEIKENKQPRQNEENLSNIGPCDIVASKDGTVVSIITRNGVPMVTEGQTFKKGDILVSGTIEIKNDAGEVIAYEYIVSDADIYAQTTYSYYDEFPMNYQIRRYLESEHRQVFLEVFHYRIICGIAPETNLTYDQLTTSKPLYLTENFQLPISIGMIKTYPYENQKKIYTKEEASQIADQHLYTFLKNLSQKGVEIYRKDVKINTSETTCVTKGRVLVKEKMTETKPVQEKTDVANERISET